MSTPHDISDIMQRTIWQKEGENGQHPFPPEVTEDDILRLTELAKDQTEVTCGGETKFLVSDVNWVPDPHSDFVDEGSVELHSLGQR